MWIGLVGKMMDQSTTIKNICPFCTTVLDNEYENEKALFTSSYTKSNVKNIKEMISYFDAVKEYMDESKSEVLYRCIKETEDEQTINLWIKRFYDDLSFLVDKIKNVLEFNSFNIKSEDISKLDEQLKSLRIDSSNLIIFNNHKVKEIVDLINQRIELILKRLISLKLILVNSKV